MNIYRENILEHYKNPENVGVLINASIRAKENNPLCGDEIQIELKLDRNKVKEAKFIGKGCVISQASADLLLSYIKNKTLNEIKKITNDDLLELIGIKLTPTRLNCALLSLSTLEKGINEYEK
ncbi:MAG: Fe-S cluster assembly sulfur transfer protein SufU [Nanoarchaeota archaeon]